MSEKNSHYFIHLKFPPCYAAKSFDLNLLTEEKITKKLCRNSVEYLQCRASCSKNKQPPIMTKLEKKTKFKYPGTRFCSEPLFEFLDDSST